MVAIILIVVIAVVIGYVLVSRLRGQRLNVRRLLVLPGVLTAIGLVQVFGLARHGYRAVDLILIAGGIVASVLLGMARGVTVSVYERDGAMWLKYRATTMWLWLATLAVRVALTVIAHSTGAGLASSGPALLLAVGTTLLGEAAVVASRASSSGAPGWQARTQRPNAGLR